MEMVVPICGPWDVFEDVTIIIKESLVLAVGKTQAGFEERVVEINDVLDLVTPYVNLYDYFAKKIGEALGVSYDVEQRDIVDWLRGHVAFIDLASAKWGKLIDKVGPFSVRKMLKRVYMPYIGHTLSLTYVAYPYPDAVVYAENKGRVMAIGSVVVEWGGVRVATAGIRTLPGALLLAQASPNLMPTLENLKKALEEFINNFTSISQCR